jgi:predicted transglutaminase-like cysteine proteinase
VRRVIYKLRDSLKIAAAGCFIVMCASGAQAQTQTTPRPLFVSLGDASRPPIGWIEFCADRPHECSVSQGEPRDVVLTNKVWKDLARINKWVNDTIKPVTDMDHWGVVEKWSYPEDGKGDCEDYVLLKRRMLMQAGWPREALLVTVVRERNGDGHAVLTVKTDKGEFILDNQHPDIRLWSDTDYRFVKRQTQFDQNTWISLGDPRPLMATATSR